MSRWLKRVSLAAAALCLILVPVTLASLDGPEAARPVGRNGAGSHGRGHTRAPSSAPRHAVPSAASVVIGANIHPISPSYLGLSIEYWGLPLFERHRVAFGRVLSLLRVGAAPLILRVGGDSADRSLWDPGLRRLPAWAFHLMPRWLGMARALIKHSPARLILDLNLVTSSPLRAAAWARAAEAKLPHGSILGFEIGNEPDIYDRPYWLATHVGASVLPLGISPRSYLRDFRAYAHELIRFAPGVPLLGPAVANPSGSVGWISQLVAHARPLLGAVSAHRYPYSACLGPGSAAYPTVARLLSEKASAGNAQHVRAAAVAAHRAGLPFRMTELNSVTCGGRAGVSDTFATALWAPDALFELLRNGVDGVNIHVRTDTVNAAMVPVRAGIRARPLLYGLILFARTLGTDPELAALRLREGSGLHLKAWAVRASGALHVLLINKGTTPASVKLRITGTGPATVQRVLAASSNAKSGETLNGQTLGSDGRWRGRPDHEVIPSGPGGYAVRLPATSEALISLR
ncbi:MAG: hypothetical protein QOD66_3803 [Solirubrobacteraceae bacterium]|nr:hypothetical protein [Solirubrobacteraceae bacterium]